MPWRNGGGQTREVAAWPARASLDTFDWRVSVASIERDVPFSRFPGVARTLVLLAGAGVRLTGPGTRLVLTQRYVPATLCGADGVQCELLEGVVQMFNVMVRGTRPARIVVGDGQPLDVAPAHHRLCFAARGRVECRVGAATAVLAAGDALALDAADAQAVLHAVPSGADSVALAVTLEPAGPA